MTRDFSHYVKDLGRGHRASSISRSRASAAPAAWPRSSAGSPRIPDVTRARVNLTDRRVAVEWKQGTLDPAALHRSPRRARLQGLSVRDRERAEADRGRGVALPAALPRRRRLRHHERDDAVDPGVVGQRPRHAARAARLLPLAVGADRAAGGGLCRPAVLPLGLARAVEHGASTWTCRSRSASCLALGMSVVETIHHAEHAYFDAAVMLLTFLLVGRYPRPEHAAANPRGRRQSRRAEGGDGGQVRRARRDLRGAGRGDPAPATSCCCGRASASRSTAS